MLSAIVPSIGEMSYHIGMAASRTWLPRMALSHQCLPNGALHHRLDFGELLTTTRRCLVHCWNNSTRAWLRCSALIGLLLPLSAVGVCEQPSAAAGPIKITADGKVVSVISSATLGLSIVGGDTGPQVAVVEPAGMLTVAVEKGEQVAIEIPVSKWNGAARIAVDVSVVDGGEGEVSLSFGNVTTRRVIRSGEASTLEITSPPAAHNSSIVIATQAKSRASGVEWRRVRVIQAGRQLAVPIAMPRRADSLPPPKSPIYRRAIERQLIEWDWRLQDGIGTPRETRTWAAAIDKVFKQGDRLVAKLTADESLNPELIERWRKLHASLGRLAGNQETTDVQWEALWRQVHWLRREMALSHPIAQTGPIAFVKRVPSSFSHQLTQYYGMTARPGGGIFVLENPGQSMRTRELVDLPLGSYEHLDVSWTGDKILFAYCQVDSAPANRAAHPERTYHLYEVRADGTGLRRLTDGPFDDFSPRYLPNGQIVFISTRRGGYHRCGAGPCPVYTMAVMNPDGSGLRVISFHETHEWDPAVMNDGRVVYTRWDYVDRNAVHYQQLWSVRPDGSDVRAFYGNNTFNPVGVWEARAVPGANTIMATASAHHAMTAGSIILLNVAKGIDGLEPITRLTPDALFPEGEYSVQRWRAPGGAPARPVPPEQRRWPGHCYRSPCPLSESFFLVAYSYEPLIGEPDANAPNMFGIYLVDRFGNKELLYRDPNIGSLWPMPLQPRRRPPVLASQLAETDKAEGTFFVQNIHESWPRLPQQERVTAIRVVQVLPKTTPHINNPRVGLANASPGKQVLGTVPVEPDGSAFFRAPARVPLLFQALDKEGMAIQTMRSLTYLQPGERASCIGCHEHGSQVPRSVEQATALSRPPSIIQPGPDGSKPLSFPVMVQPVLDKHCVGCHAGKEPAGGVRLTGKIEGSFTASYNALAPRVAITQWKGSPKQNAEPLTWPGRFGARASSLTKLLSRHYDVQLSAEDRERLYTWMDTNGLFYGTFDPADQKRQQRGERIDGPALE